MSDDFTRERFMWLEQVAADRELSRLALHVAFALSGYVNRETGEAWPSQSRLADDCGLTRNGLRNAIDALRLRGHLHVAAGQGRANSSRYRWIIAEKGNSHCPIASVKGQRPLPYSDPKRATAVTEKGNSRSDKRATAIATNSLKELFEGTPSPAAHDVSKSDTGEKEEIGEEELPPAAPSSAAPSIAKPRNPPTACKASRPDDAALGAAFDRFRAAYPKRSGSNWTKARESFDRAVKRGASTAEIIGGALAYAGYCVREGNTGERAKFIKLPVTWLNQSEWTVDYGPVAATSGRPSMSASLTDAQWRERLARFQRTAAWPQAFGARPGTPECAAPLAILAEFDIGAA